MKNKAPEKKIIQLIQSSFYSLFAHKEILFPFTMIALVQLLFLEIIYFLPRSPLTIFFGPIIRKLFGEAYLHYPFNFMIMPKIFQNLQIPLYIIVNSFFVGMAIAIIKTINNDEKIDMKKISTATIKGYVHIFCCSLIALGLVKGLFFLFGKVYVRATMIGATTGIKVLIKNVILDGAPYWNLLISVVVSTLLAYVIPSIIIDKKKIFGALINNAKNLWGSFWYTFIIILIPTLLYIPVLLLRKSLPTNTIPELHALIIIISIVVMIIIDAISYTAITTYYLLKKEIQ